ncbi:apolipophorins [Lucilia cuprina]|uniref:apolipophorins n=1 Tax=Lucilia cuprina TaxID=7375 RepID=UPI001F0636C8|nr:apolipophorins [Lucilia cuprina]
MASSTTAAAVDDGAAAADDDKTGVDDGVDNDPLKDPKICGRPHCDADNDKFKYNDNIFKYDYTLQLRTEFSGTGENTSDLYLKANIDVFFPKPCEGYLRINDVRLFDKIEHLEQETSDTNSNTASNDVYDYYGELERNSDTDFGSSDENSESPTTNEHPKSRDLENDLKKNLLRFAFHDGLISEICPTLEEPTWVLNFKKGILSAFQNTMMRFDVDFNTTETDVSGICNVQYTLQTTDNVFVTIRKDKDVKSCRNRYSTHSVLQTTPYNFRDDKTIWPILDSQSYCNFTIDNNIYRDISCYERHQLIPFSNASTGAVTTTTQTLEFKGEDTFSVGEFLAENNEFVEKRSTLLFDHTPAIKPTHGEIKASRDLLKEMCAVGYPKIQREFIEVFTNFLQTTKYLDYKALTQLLARSAGICENGKNHVLESLPYIGSTASYQLMRDQIIANAIPKRLAHSWMTSLSFIQRPDEETLETFFTILEFSRKKVDPEYTLGASAVIHSFCRHNENCGENLKVQRIVNLLETEFLSLFNMYRGERRTRERMIIILKGLGNIGVMSQPFAAQLQEIITQNITAMEIRLQAVIAFRRVDCMAYREFFMESYANYTLNSEIRIFSYLQAMRCPDYLSISRIKSILEYEEINQVGSFVWSHLKNLAKSSSPIRIEAQGLLLNDDLSDKFKLDIRKFSRNYEHSLFFDEYNFGTTTDLNLLFGTDSYLPRMATLNFTSELFGQAVNFWEISARAEGFEEMVSTVFGPKGPLNREFFRKKFSFLNKLLGTESSEDDDTLENLLNLDTLRLKRDVSDDEEENFEEDYEFEEDLSRTKRSTTPENEGRKDKVQKQVRDMGYKLNYNYNNPKAQIGLRIFGNDLRHYSLEGNMEFMAFAKEFDPFQQIAKILSGQEITYTKSNVLLDASYSVPLAIGLALSINAFGASSVDFRVSGNLDRVEPATDWHFDLEGKFKPSVSVDVITSIQADMFYAVSGIKVKSNLYSNSEIEAKLKVRGKNLVSFSFDLPQDTNEIFSARSELLVLKEDKAIPQAGIEARRSNSSCTWPVLDQAIGLQLCSYFSVPDLANSSDKVYPSLLLSGPTNFSVILKKSDLTAKKYVFEYNWDQVINDSSFSLVFHTPGSAAKRLLVTNVTTTPDAFNASVAFVNANTRVSAGCNYNSHPDDRRLDVFLDTNGNRSFDLNMELKRWQDRTAWMYKPKMLLAINGVNVTGLIGTIRINEKNGITQNDFELSFETKKLQAMVKGNFVQTEITTSTNLTVNYRFQANKIETINFDGKLVNTGDKSKTEYRGNVKLKTSAYPKLNFVSNATWLSLQGHTEGVVTYNNDPYLVNPDHTSSVRLIFARSYSEDLLLEGSHTRASFEVKIPKSKVDFKVSLKHEERSKNGTEHNVLLGLRYAPEKEATGLFSIHLPRRSLFAIDAYVNVTVPEFNSCTARIKLTEVTSKSYMINLNGSWFTGHSISLKGNYKDKSSRVQSLHHLKLVVESPSFKVTSLNVVYRRNQMILFTDVQTRYGVDPYGLTVQYNGNEVNKNANAEIRLKVKEKDYWLNAKLLSEQPKLLQVEIHLDKLRDIHIKLGLLSIEQRKELSLELKWDANRDPSQRLGLLAEFNNPGNRRYEGNVMVTYPDRTISCGFDAFTGGPQYYGSARASWSVSEMVVFTYNAGVMPGKQMHNWIQAELSTPFQGWRKNSVNAGVYNRGNLILANTTLIWADDQILELGYKSDYEMVEPIVSFDIYFGINSTVKDIPIINVKVKHWQDMKKFDSVLNLRYSGANETLNVYSIKSLWELAQSAKTQNISGTVFLVTPFEGYRKGGLAAKFMLNDKREIQGAASLDFEIREFTLAIDGYVRKFSDNMLTVNITTPLEKFRTINGRFGLNEKKHHAVAEVRAPTAALGAEVLFDIISLMNFDVKLSVATPIESFQQAALFAKIKTETVDLRGMWNNATLGFTGVWRMDNIADFEYSYKVFTPLPGFEENGFIAKFKKENVFVFYLHGKLSKYKLGFKINGHPKSKLLTQLGGNKIELELLYDDDFQPPKIDSEDYDMDDIEYDEFLSYFVEFEIDTLVWPTVEGFGDIQEVMDYYIVVGNLQLPQGRIDLKDRLYYPDYINVINVLTVTTPFEVAKEVKSIVEYHIDLDYNFLYDKMHFIVSNGGDEPAITGFELNYTKIDDSVKPKEHNLQINIKTPFETLKDMNIWGRLEMEMGNIYKGNISSRTASTFLSLAGSVEVEENFLETSVGILLNTNVIPHYACRAYFKKDFSQIDNSVDIQFVVTDNDVINELQIETAWRKDPGHLVNVDGRVKTTMLPLQLVETNLQITKSSNPQLSFDLGFVSQTGHRIEYGTRANKKDDIFNVEVWTPIENFRNISMHGSLIQNRNNPKEYHVSGNLYRNMVTYALNGVIRMAENYPTDTRLRVQPKSGGRDGVIELSITEAGGNQKGYNFQFSAIEDGEMCQISGGYSQSEESGMDFSVLVQSSLPEIKRINFNGKLRPREKGHVIGDISLETPWKELGIDSVKLHSDIAIRKDSGNIGGEYRIGPNIGRGNCIWSWIWAENMQLTLESYMERPEANPRIVHASAKYINPDKNYLRLVTGAKLDVDSKWKLAVNGTMNYRSSDDLQANIVTLLPQPIGDVHNFGLRYRGNLVSKQGVQPELFLEGKYLSQEAKRKYLGRVSYRNTTDLQGMGHVEWGVDTDISTVEGDFQMLRKDLARREFYAKLITPKFKEQDTFFMKGNYDLRRDEYHTLACTIDYPASRPIADMDVAYKTISNMYGFVNSTTPFLNVSWFKGDFNFTTQGPETYRFFEGSWPSDSSYFKLHSFYHGQELEHNLKGNIEMEIPLTTRHRADIEYGLNEKPDLDKGFLKINYNEKQILNGVYKCVEQHDPLHVITTDITVENEMKPLGIHYVNTKDMAKPGESLDIKHIQIFELKNVENFNLTGELYTTTKINGQEFKIVAIHPNRTVVLTTNYEEDSEKMVKHRSKLELSQTAWIGYNLELSNYTVPGNDSRKFVIDLSYPKRTLSTEGWYYNTESKFFSDIEFKWTNPESFDEDDVLKVVRTAVLWQDEPLRRGDKERQSLLVTIGHPYLEKDVTLKANYHRNNVELLKTDLMIDYSDDKDHAIVMGAVLKDMYQEFGYTNYTFKFFAHHIASELDVQVNGTLAAKSSYYKTESYANYKRSFYPEKHGKFLALLDLNRKEIEYIRNSPYRSVRFWAIPTINHPVYGLNATVWDTPDTNNTGYIIVDILNKFARAEVNLTEDASQNLQLIGSIPDARSGYLDIWRNYEEIRIIDISSYLKMNHSRLITGRFHWRPKIKQEVKEKFHSIGSSVYNSFSEGIDFWVKSLYSETIEAVGIIWDTSKGYNQRFFDDIGKLSVLEEDLDDLRLFVNQSYEANDFYIKTVVNFTLTIIDELAIRDHIESLPKIFSELWQAMGDSGKALRNSVVWLIETIKKTYNNVLETISRFLHGDSLQYLSGLLEKGVHKYDKFIKDLHISFIKYVENLWNKFWSMMSNYWRGVLKRLEPHIFKFISHVESALWNLSKELFDFIYKRTNELAESPYFNKVSSFTQDVDRLYRDIKSNDAITNIKKYSLIAWNFIKEKYFKLVPFGAELNEVLTEIWEEIKELQKIEQVELAIQKYREVMAKLEWVAEELQFEARLHELYALIANKLRNYATNALETADMYREAKTKFIFDPEMGIIDLEQKLPMSWHAFNETPKFEEIPEYKFLAKAQNILSTTNSSVIRSIYNMRQHLDPKTWLPPYYSRALLIDSRHYMTFDKRFVGLNLRFEQMSGSQRNRQCSYLLTHDFFQGNFTLMLEPSASVSNSDTVATRKLNFIANGELIEIDLGTDRITINGDQKSLLPLKLNDVTISRDLDILSINSDTEFSLSCNVQFDLCWFEVSGWYFGKTAGVLGTMNNEIFDEFTTSHNQITKNPAEFTDSWSVESCKQKMKPNTLAPTVPEVVSKVCDYYFKSGMLSACADTVDIEPFYDICLDLGSNSNAVRPGHPANKGACTAALAYIEACTSAKIPMRVPDQCVYCQLTNGSYVPEGTFVELTAADVPRSSDVVFIVEAKPCNTNLTENKNIMSIVSTLEEQLLAHKISNNRYAVVTFGGVAPFDKPRSIYYENSVFTHDFNNLAKYFAHIDTTNGTNNDILQAISTASRLNFRPGVSKTFILLTCSDCAARHMRFDYSSILQYMREEGVNLHILADTEFDFEKTRKLRHFFGLDRELVYSKRFPEGDNATRAQLRIPKSNLGICIPLALETNGSVFSARKLLPKFKYPIKRFATIFAKRVAKSAAPPANQTCECSGHNTGVSYMACSPSTDTVEDLDIEDYDFQFNGWEWDDVSNEMDS